MINPYIHFGEKNIWPRGFRLSDIGDQHHNKFYFLDSKQLQLKPLIFQGLINGVPDNDSIFQKTKISNSLIFLFLSLLYIFLDILSQLIQKIQNIYMSFFHF